MHNSWRKTRTRFEEETRGRKEPGNEENVTRWGSEELNGQQAVEWGLLNFLCKGSIECRRLKA